MNLLSGCVGIWYLRMGAIDVACYMIFLAAILDFFDGFAARALNALSPIGKDLDSLADVVSFGALPGMILCEMMRIVSDRYTFDGTWIEPVIVLSGIIITIFSALRLAKFNIDTRQTDVFLGLPTPMNAIFIASLPLIMMKNWIAITDLILNVYVLGAIILLNSFLLVSEVPLMALKFKSFAFGPNAAKYIFLILTLILLLSLQIFAIPVVFLLYIIISLFSKKRTNEIQSGN